MRGDQLRRMRTRHGLTQVDLAKLIGVASNTVARWERDELSIREPVSRLIRLVLRPDARLKTKTKNKS